MGGVTHFLKMWIFIESACEREILCVSVCQMCVKTESLIRHLLFRASCTSMQGPLNPASRVCVYMSLIKKGPKAKLVCCQEAGKTWIQCHLWSWQKAQTPTKIQNLSCLALSCLDPLWHYSFKSGFRPKHFALRLKEKCRELKNTHLQQITARKEVFKTHFPPTQLQTPASIYLKVDIFSGPPFGQQWNDWKLLGRQESILGSYCWRRTGFFLLAGARGYTLSIKVAQKRKGFER